MSDLTQEIVLAAEAGNLEKVKEALQKGASPDAMGPNSGALHCASFNGHKDVVATLLKAGANPNVKDNQGFYPLHLAASKGYTAICNALLKAGADLEATTEKGGTPLHVAVASNFGQTVTALIKAGAKLEARDIYGYTAIATAAGLGRNSILKSLLKVGADKTVVDDGGDTLLHKAIRNMYNARIDSWSSTGTNGSRQVKYEITKGCFRYDRNYEGKPGELGEIMSLKDQRYCASQDWGPNNHIEYLDALDTVKTLLKENLDVNAANDSGQTAMSLACHTGEAKIIQELHKLGASFDSKDSGEATPLHRVAGSGRIDGLELYFQLVQNYDINVGDINGWTPLHYLADIGGHLKMAEILLAKGADKNAKTTKYVAQGLEENSTPSKVALHWNDTEMANFLSND